MNRNTFFIAIWVVAAVFLRISTGVANAQTTDEGALDFSPLEATATDIRFNTYPNGDRIPDYSYCGYMGGEEPIPDLLLNSVPVIKVPCTGGEDAGAAIRQALDYASTFPLGESGFRAVVLLDKGEYNINGSLLISSSGVVLRGAGQGETVLVAKGTSRETVIKIAGTPDRKILSEGIPITCDYLPVNSVRIPLEKGHSLKEGMNVIVTRPSTEEWIKLLGADKIGLYADYNIPSWTAGDFDLNFSRTVVEAGEDYIVVDVPLPQSFEKDYGGGTVSRYEWDGRIEKCAVENLSIVSEYDTVYPKDEDHRWMAITVDSARDCWIRRVDARCFVSSAVFLLKGASRVSVEECRSLSPVGEIGGYRRIAFQTMGEQNFFNRCYSEGAYHAFAVGPLSTGPNAFLQCWAADSYGFSGALGGWSCGTLFDRVTVENAPIKFSYIDLDLQGGGWSAANSLCWQCRAPQIHIDNPPLAHNYAYGSRGQGYGRGSHGNNKITRPEYFYLTQYFQRKGAFPEGETDKVIKYNPDFSKTDAVFAARESARSLEPAMNMNAWIDSLCVRYPLASFPENAKGQVITFAGKEKQLESSHLKVEKHPLSIVNGRIAADGKYLAGKSLRTALWRGTLRPSSVNAAGVHLTRFVPGMDGTGYTDVFDSVPQILSSQKAASLWHFPALWYERRRDDHGRMTRADADVWAPFYEQPFARSGKGEASDRLSRYDLDRWNKWYWSRISEFSLIADECGIAFVHEHYLQHNLIEEGAHWIDYPWRDANNINSLGFKEPTYMQGDKRVFMAQQFYDLNNKKLVSYHKKYIRKSLDEVSESSNTINHLGVEYTGPADFLGFWLRTIAKWQDETGKDTYVAFSATRDVTEEVLRDETLGSVVDVIDIRQWHYRSDSTLYAPQGGVSLTQRQYARIMDVGKTDLAGVWRAVREYRERFPDKAVLYNSARVEDSDWVAFVSGASLCALPAMDEVPNFYSNALEINSLSPYAFGRGTYAAGKKGVGYVVYCESGSIDLSAAASLSDKTAYKLVWIEPKSGKVLSKTSGVRLLGAGSGKVLTAPDSPAVAYLYK